VPQRARAGGKPPRLVLGHPGGAVRWPCRARDGESPSADGLRRFRQRHRRKPRTLGGDAGYEAGQFLQTLEEDLKIQPHIPISAERVTTPGPEGDARRRMLRRMKTRAYQLSQRARKKVEQVFGWLKQPGGLRKVRHVGRWKIQQVAYLWAAAYPSADGLRMANLELQQAVA